VPNRNRDACSIVVVWLLRFQGVPKHGHRHRPRYGHVVSLPADQKHESASQFAREVRLVLSFEVSNDRVAFMFCVQLSGAYRENPQKQLLDPYTVQLEMRGKA